MDYGKTINRAVTIVWEYKFLILLGILAGLAGGSTSSFSGNGSQSGQPVVEPGQGITVDPGQMPGFSGEAVGLAAGVVVVILCAALFIGIALWVVSSIARGGLVAAVDTIESGGKAGFMQGWRAGWQRIWTLLGIGFIPAIPGLLLFMLGIVALGAYGGFAALLGGENALPLGIAELGIIGVLVACVAIPIVLALSILRVFAERACMLENLGVVDSYRRGYQVLTANLGEALMLFLLQIVLSIVLAVFFFLPGIIAAICFCLWPLLLAFQGAVTAAVSALWTLAWRTWTGGQPIVEKVPTPV